MSDSDDMPPLEDDEFQSHVGASVTRRTHYANSVNAEVTSEGEDSDSDDEDEWEDMEEVIIQNIKCLFCADTLSNIQVSLAHLMDTHGFDLVSFLSKLNVDQTDYIKFINYVRQEQPSPERLLTEDTFKWNSTAYMRPVLDEDSLLMCDVEELTSRQEQQDCDSEIDLRATCDELKEIVMKQHAAMQRIFQFVQTNSQENELSVKTVGDLRPEEDKEYFNSYAHFDIHHEMLSDKVRTESYRDAILNNSALLNGKRVLDLGCGTAILSMFSAKAGAIVTGVDMSDVIYQAIDIVSENKLDNAITLYKGRLEDLHFEHKFDYIVSEWMGYFLLFEGMLDSVLYAREKHLAEGGLLLPNRCTMHLIGMEDMDTYKKLVAFWDNVYGFKMSCMRKDVIKEASTDVIKKQCLVTSAAQIADFDLMTITPNETEFTTNFSLVVEKDSQITGFVGYFDIYFEMPNPVFFSTGPHVTPTHWKQTVFYLPEPHPVKMGEILQGTISVCRKRKEVRALEVGINFGNQKLKYLIE